MVEDDRRWNGNLHLLRRLLGGVPAGARRGLDVGCGEGVTARLLRRHVDEAVGIDPDGPSIDLARAQGGDISYVTGSFLDHPFEPHSFDVVTAVAVLHHVDLEAGLERLRSLVAPGGRLFVVGFARYRTPLDYAYAAIGTVWVRRYSWLRGSWETPAPKRLDFPASFGEVHRTVRRLLPGARFRRDVLFRFTVEWTAP